MPRDLLINMTQNKSLTTRFVFHVALDKQVYVCYKSALFLTSFINAVRVTYGRRIRHSKTVLIRQKGDDKKDFM